MRLVFYSIGILTVLFTIYVLIEPYTYESVNFRLYKYDLDYNFLGFIAEICSSIAAVVVAIATLYTVREMSKGREQAVYPHLTFLNTNLLEVNWVMGHKTLQIQHSHDLDRSPLSHHGREKYPAKGIYIKNIGLGSAKEIHAKWEIVGMPLEEFLPNVDEFKNFMDHVDDESLVLDVISEGYKKSSIIKSEELKGEGDSYLSCSIAGNGGNNTDELEIPSSILNSIALRALSTALEDYDTSQNESFNANLKLTYKDIYNKNRMQYFRVSFNSIISFFEGGSYDPEIDKMVADHSKNGFKAVIRVQVEETTELLAFQT